MDIRKEVLIYLKAVKGGMVRNMDHYKRNATFHSLNSLQESVEQVGSSVIGTLSSPDKSWLVMEKGRKPGPVPKNFVGIIKAWIVAKGISVTPKPYIRPNAGKGFSPEERGLRSMAGAIAWNIRKKGTKLHRDLGYNDIYTTPINQGLLRLRASLTLAVVTEVKRINQEIKNDAK